MKKLSTKINSTAPLIRVFYIILALTAIGNDLFSQYSKIPVDSATNKVVFTEVVEAKGVSKNDLYVAAKEWFVLTFKSADAVLQMDDNQNGRLIGKGYSEITLPPILGISTTTRMYYTISISIKDDRFKYEISRIYYKSYAIAHNPSYISYPDSWYVPESIMYKNNGKVKFINKGYYDKTLEAINTLIRSLKNSMNAENTINDHW